MNPNIIPNNLTNENLAMKNTNPNYKQAMIIENLYDRDQERRELAEIKANQRRRNEREEETSDYFSKKFTEQAGVIKEQMIKIQKIMEKDTEFVKIPENFNAQKEFTGIVLNINELQAYLTTSTKFLPDYNVRMCQKVLSDLTSLSDELRQLVMPQKKFGFKARKAMGNTKQIQEKKENSEMAEITTVDGIKKDWPEKKPLQFIDTAAPLCSYLLRNEENLYKIFRGSLVNKTDVHLTDLKNCFIEIQGYPSSVRISNVTDCVILCGPVASSIYAESCRNTKFAFACQQLRLHESIACRVYVCVTCRSVMEDSKEIEFDLYNYKYADIEKDFQLAGLDRSKNNYKDVADFNWLSPDVHSPNWKIIENETKVNWMDLPEEFKKKFNCKEAND